MDYLTLRKHCQELNQALQDRPLLARVFAIPGRGFCLRLKRADSFSDFIFQLDPATQGCHLSNSAIEIEKTNSLLRQMQRLLINGRIVGVETAGAETELQFDRVVKIQIAVIDNFFGNRSDYFLICEFTGRIADIFLCDNEMKIIDRFGRTSNNSIGSRYRLPNSDCALNPFLACDSDLEKIFQGPHQTWADKLGILSPQFSKELAWRSRANKTIAGLIEAFREIISESLAATTWLTIADGRAKAITGYDLHYLPGTEKKSFVTVGAALEFCEKQLIATGRFDQAKQQVRSHFDRELHNRRRVLLQQLQLQKEFADADRLQKTGNLLVANLYRIKPGADSIELEDWDTGEKITILLDPAKSASNQAQRYFQRFRKAQRGQAEVARRIKELEAEMSWLKEQIWLTDNAQSEADLPEIEKKNRQKGKTTGNSSAARRKKPYFPHFAELDNCRFFIGKNGRQNDMLTFQVASAKDRWFHANDVPGAHVIAKKLQGEFNETDIFRGALLAAWFSFARDSSKVAVDTTEVSRVKKIPGGGPGRVSYTHQTTLFVNPQDAKNLFGLSTEPKTGESNA